MERRRSLRHGCTSRFVGKLFGEHRRSAGRFLGTVDSINAITRDQVAGYYRARYTPGPTWSWAAAGSLDHDTGGRAGPARPFAGVPPGRRPARPGRGWPPRAGPPAVAGAGCPGIRAPAGRDAGSSAGIEQANLIVGWRGAEPGPTTAGFRARRAQRGRSAAGMSSRLFQEVREKRGLAYSVYSSPPSTPTPASGGYLRRACLPSKADDVLSDLPGRGSPRSCPAA